MTGDDLKLARERLGWSRRQLAEALNASLGTDYNPERTVGRWERDERRVPETVSSFLRELEMETVLPDEPEVDLAALGLEEPPGPRGEDSPPPSPDVDAQLPLHAGGGAHARVCEELWEMIATAAGLAGVVLNSEALKGDRDILLADKQALGRAWGKLAETNDTFRRMLLGMTGGGAWLEVAMVTGITVGKLSKNHSEVRELERAARMHQAAQQEAEEPTPAGAMRGEDGVLIFPAAAG